MATFAQTLNAVSSDVLALSLTLSAKPDDHSQADSRLLEQIASDFVTQSMSSNALAVETKLANDATALDRLAKFTADADAKANALAKSEANVSRFVSLATHVRQLLTATGAGNVGACASNLLSACKDLGIVVH